MWNFLIRFRRFLYDSRRRRWGGPIGLVSNSIEGPQTFGVVGHFDGFLFFFLSFDLAWTDIAKWSIDSCEIDSTAATRSSVCVLLFVFFCACVSVAFVEDFLCLAQSARPIFRFFFCFCFLRFVSDGISPREAKCCRLGPRIFWKPLLGGSAVRPAGNGSRSILHWDAVGLDLISLGSRAGSTG